MRTSVLEEVDAGALARYFRVLGDPTRVRIVRELLEGDRSVGDLVTLLDAPQSRVSNHLACLRWCRVVTSRRRGRVVEYRIADGRIADLLELALELSSDTREYLASCSRIGPDWI
jgi:DNA-binding transcriptional ArsR family regulator